MTPTIAVAQMNCRLGQVEANQDRIGDLARRVGEREPDIVCFPELATSGYSLNERWRVLAQPIPGSTTEVLGQIASEFGFYLIAGIAERDTESNRIFNSAVLMNPKGDVVGVYRKVHLCGKERRYLTPGNQFPVFGTRIGTIGIGICYDLEFPEVARILAMKGARILFFPSAQDKPFQKHLDAFIHTRAAENGVFVAFSNRIGREGTTTFCGGSRIVSPECSLLAQSGGSEAVAAARVDFAIFSKERKRVPYLHHRVPSAYRALANSGAPSPR